MSAFGVRWSHITMALWAALVAAGFIGVQALGGAMHEHAVEARMNDFRTHLSAAGAYAEAQDFPRAFERVKEAITLAPDMPQPHIALGDLHYRLGQWQQASKAYGKARALGPVPLGVWLNSVWAHIELEHYTAAAALGREGLTSGQDDPALHRYVAEALFRLEHYAEALPHLRAAIEGFPNDLYLWEHVRYCHEALGNAEEAEVARRRILSIQGSISDSLRDATTTP